VGPDLRRGDKTRRPSADPDVFSVRSYNQQLHRIFANMQSAANQQRDSAPVVVFTSLRLARIATAPDRPSCPAVTEAWRLASCFCRKNTGINFSPDGRAHIGSPLLLEQCHGNVAKLVASFLPETTTPGGHPQNREAGRVLNVPFSDRTSAPLVQS
jgi:hypothetical protein